jgi:hypothetical protein
LLVALVAQPKHFALDLNTVALYCGAPESKDERCQSTTAP